MELELVLRILHLYTSILICLHDVPKCVCPSFPSLLCTTVHGQSAAAYLAAESPIAKANLLANIGPSGAKSQGAKAGVVIASPSTSNPNYLFTWTRDSALVFQTIINQSVCDTP
jgi:Glycosyl hydrolases family 15